VHGLVTDAADQHNRIVHGIVTEGEAAAQNLLQQQQQRFNAEGTVFAEQQRVLRQNLEAAPAEQRAADLQEVTAGVAKLNFESAQEREQSDARYAELQHKATQAIQNERAAHQKTAAERAASADAAKAKAKKDADKVAQLEQEVDAARSAKRASSAAARALKEELERTKAAAAAKSETAAKKPVARTRSKSASRKKRVPSLPKKAPPVCFLCNGEGHVAANCITHGHTSTEEWKNAALITRQEVSATSVAPQPKVDSTPNQVLKQSRDQVLDQSLKKSQAEADVVRDSGGGKTIQVIVLTTPEPVITAASDGFLESRYSSSGE